MFCNPRLETKTSIKKQKTAYFEFSGGTQTNSRGQDGSELFITSFSTTQQMTAHTVRKFFLKNSKVSPTTRERKWKRWWRIGRDIWTMPRIGLFPEPHVLSRKEIVSVMIWVCRQPLPFQKMFFSKLAFSNFQAFNWTLEASKLPLIYWRKLARPNNAQLEVELFNINEENITSKATVWPYVEIRKN